MARKNKADQDTSEDGAALEETTTPETGNQGSQHENTPEVPQAVERGTEPEAPQNSAAAVEPQVPEEPAAGAAQPGPEARPLRDELFSLEALAAEYRTASWQQAALVRLMGWAGGKLVSRAQYESAMNALTNRRQGGGRR